MKRTIFLILGLIGLGCYYFFSVAPAEKTYQNVKSELSEAYSIGVDGLLQKPDSALTALDQDSSLSEIVRRRAKRKVNSEYALNQERLRLAKNAAESSRKIFYLFLGIWCIILFFVLTALIVQRRRARQVDEDAFGLGSGEDFFPEPRSRSSRRPRSRFRLSDLSDWLREMPINNRLLVCAGLMLLLVIFGLIGWWTLAPVFPWLAIILLYLAVRVETRRRWFLYMIPIMYVVIWIATIIAIYGGAK